MNKKLSPAMLAALHYYLGNLAGYSQDSAAVKPKTNTINALFDKGLLVLNSDKDIIPTPAGIEALGGLDAIANRKLAVEEPVSLLNASPEDLAVAAPVEPETLTFTASILGIEKSNHIKLSALKGKVVKTLVPRDSLPIASGSEVVIIDLSLDDLSLSDKQISTALKNPEKFNAYASSLLTVQFGKAVCAFRLDELGQDEVITKWNPSHV